MKLLKVMILFSAALGAQTLRLPGELKPYQQVAVAARVTGIVEKVHVDRGSVVKQGELLVELSAPEMDAQIAEAAAKVQSVESQKVEAEAKVAAQESVLERLKAASKTQGAVADNDIVQAQKSVDAAKAVIVSLEKNAAAARAQVDALKRMQAYLKIEAPFDGVITERIAHPGALASPATGALLELQQVSRLRLVVAVPEAEYGSVVRGKRLAFTVPAHVGKTFQGVVARAARSLDASTRTMAVELDVTNAGGALAPGMYCEVEWPAAKKN